MVLKETMKKFEGVRCGDGVFIFKLKFIYLQKCIDGVLVTLHVTSHILSSYMDRSESIK